jgi:heme-binding protein
MSRRLKRVAVVSIVVFAAAQLVRPERANPPIDPSRTIQAHVGPTGLVAVLDRSCGDCHSNQTVWPWYTEIAPLSWLMAYAVNEGRKAVNFSDWTAYTTDQQQTLLAQSCQDVSQGKMPGAYTMVRPATRLSPQDVEVVCAALGQTQASLPREGKP